jgi:hypothetical protein
MTIDATLRARPECLRHSFQERFRDLVREFGALRIRGEIRWSLCQETCSQKRWRIPITAANGEVVVLENF